MEKKILLNYYLQHLFSNRRLFQGRDDIHNNSHIDDLDKNAHMIILAHIPYDRCINFSYIFLIHMNITSWFTVYKLILI